MPVIATRVAQEELTPLVIDEPVRGSVPPPWFWALPGIERIEALARGYIELPPLSRLMGVRPAHVGLGSGTWIMPASECTEGIHGTSVLSMLIDDALTGVATTTLRRGQYVEAETIHIDSFRPAHIQTGNFIARARVTNMNPFFLFTECQIEDPQGREVASARCHAEIIEMERPPPAPPTGLSQVESPTYATPDPYLRSYPSEFRSLEDIESDGFLGILRKYKKGELTWPFATLVGYRLHDVEKGSLSLSMPASEWFCLFSRTISSGSISSLLYCASFAALTLQEPSKNYVALTRTDKYYRTVPADGRMLRLEATAELGEREMITSRARLYDEDGNLVAVEDGTGMIVDAGKRRKSDGPAAKRVLCTLLFTDIVGSTELAERLGDTKWRAILDEHHAKVRTEIAQYQGTEIDTAGDGFFVRFDSPALAIESARAIVDSVKALGIDLRAGIHTGECEVLGRNLSGMAVHIAARIQGQAGPGEILVSGTVKDLVVGSDMTFTPRGEHDLKGIPGTWSLHAVV